MLRSISPRLLVATVAVASLLSPSHARAADEVFATVANRDLFAADPERYAPRFIWNPDRPGYIA